ncbi:MAG TPA: protease inhibitor I42 family protein [Symbiobacteriaceae bacterium]|nr:protease inhibitor I42 family protein [Symbiobacteriaceae bacterium]
MPQLLVGGHRIHDGETGRARVGELVIITADEKSASTGYRWEIGPLVPGLELVSEETVGADADRPGASALRRFNLKAQSRGSYSVSLHLCRPWEATPADEWHCTLIV